MDKGIFKICMQVTKLKSQDSKSGHPPPPLKNHKNIGFSSWKSQSFQTSIQYWAIIGTQAKHHLMVFHWLVDDGPLIVVLGSSLPSSTKTRGPEGPEALTWSS